MPRFDKYPQKRGLGNALYNPLRSGIQGWTDPIGAIDEAAQRAGTGIRQRFEDTVDQALDGIVAAVLDATGIDISGPVALLEQLLDIPLGFLDGTTLGSATDVLGQFFPFLPGANPDDFDLGSAATQFINAILNPTGLLANWTQLYQRITGAPSGALDELGDLFQHGLFGQIAAGRLGQISAASIDNLNPETLDNPGFDTDASIRDNEEVEWDGTFGRTRPGSMKIVADGTTHTSVSNPLRVVQSRTINVEIWTYYENVVANPGTTPIRLSVAAFNAPVVEGGPPVWVADTLIPAPSIASPAGNSSAVAGNVSGWVKILGSYTVPAGVDRVVNKVQVTEDCLSGTVHFDDGSRKRAGMLPKEYVEGLLADLAAHAAKIQATLNKGWEALTGLPAAVDKSVDDLKTALQNIPQANIQNFAAALAGAGQDIRDAIVQALGGTGTGHTAADVIAALMNIPQDAIAGLEDELADLGDAAADAVEGLNTLVANLANNPAGTLGDLTENVIDGIGTTLGGFLNLLRNAFTGGSASSSTASDVANAANTVAGTATNAVNAAQTATALATYAGGRALWESANPTIDATMLESSLGTGSTPTYFTISQTASAMGFIRTRVAQDKTIVQWIGRGNSLTTAKLHVYRLNTTTGDATWVQTKNIVPGTLPTAAAFGRVIVQLDAAVHMEPGDVLALEVCVTGGNHDIAGLTIPWLTPDDSALPKGPGASRNSGTESAAPTTIAAANVPYSTKIPFIGAGIPQAELPPPSYAYYFTDTFNSLAAWTALPGGNFQANGGYATNPTANPSFLLYNNSSYSDKTVAGFTTAPIAVGTIAGFNNGSYIRYFTHANAACTQGVGFELASNGSTSTPRASIALVTLVGGVRTVRATTSVQWTLKTEKYFRISYDPATQTYSTNISGLSWTDSGNEIQHGPDYRRIAIFSDFATVNNPGAQYSGVCADIIFYDAS